MDAVQPARAITWTLQLKACLDPAHSSNLTVRRYNPFQSQILHHGSNVESGTEMENSASYKDEINTENSNGL